MNWLRMSPIMKPVPQPKRTNRRPMSRKISRRTGSSGDCDCRYLPLTTIHIIAAMPPAPRPIKGKPPLGEQSKKFIICAPPSITRNCRRRSGAVGVSLGGSAASAAFNRSPIVQTQKNIYKLKGCVCVASSSIARTCARRLI